MTTLAVYLYNQPVGDLQQLDDHPLELRFNYAPQYLSGAGAIALSESLPLTAEPYIGAAARNWFANLLPEGGARQHLAASFNLTIQDDFGLLQAIGRECAGAVSLVPAGEAPARAGNNATRALNPAQIEEWVRSRPRGSLSRDRPMRLSLAGAQDKIGVVSEADGSLSEPLDGAVSSHILKAPNDNYPGLVSLEALGIRLARAVGIPVPAATLVGKPSACLLIERFDREIGADGSRARIHQEDFCQALGLPPEHKYESQGGPSFERCFNLVRKLGLGAPALNALIDWAAFNVLIANGDAHGKNLATLRRRNGSIELAPFYDLVPTGVYSAALLDRDLAMKVGNARTVDDVTSEDWALFARACGLAPRYVTQRVRALVERAHSALGETANQLIEDGADDGAIKQGTRWIAERCDATLSGNPFSKQDSAPRPSGPWGMSL